MLSIIIITKNEENYLPKLLKSIKNQTYKDYEIIVSDANSTDKTREIAKSFGCKIVDGGMPSVGRNAGAKAASGEILVFMDADGIIPKDFFEKTIKEFKQRNISCATTFYKPLSRSTIDRIAYKVYSFWAFIMQYLSPYAGGFFIIVKKEVYRKAGGFNEEIVFTEDHEFVKSCSKIGKFRILYSSYVLGNMRRIKKDGRIRFFVKLLTAALYRIFIGPIKGNIFEYNLHGNPKMKRINYELNREIKIHKGFKQQNTKY